MAFEIFSPRRIAAQAVRQLLGQATTSTEYARTLLTSWSDRDPDIFSEVIEMGRAHPDLQGDPHLRDAFLLGATTVVAMQEAALISPLNWSQQNIESDNTPQKSTAV